MVPAGLPIERSSIEKDKDSPFTGMALSLFLWVVMLRNGTFHCAVGGASIPSLSGERGRACLSFGLELSGDGAFKVVDDFLDQEVQVPADGFLGVVFFPAAVLQFVIDSCVGLSAGIAEGEDEAGGVVVIGQGEDFHRLDHTHF